MKSNRLKYIFSIFVLILIGLAIYIVNQQKQTQENTIYTDIEPNYIRIEPNIDLSIVNYDTFNPIKSNNKNVQDMSKLVYESLLSVTKDFKVQGCIANEWSKIGEKSYIITINKEKIWQDGSKVITDDIIYTIQQIKKLGEKSIYFENVKKVSKVEKIDEFTIKIELEEEIPFYEYFLTFPILKNNTGDDELPIGTGVYKIDTKDTEKIVLELDKTKKENQNNKIESISIHFYSSIGEVYNDFKIGNLDLITTSNMDYKTYIGTIGYKEKIINGREYNFIAINTQSEFLQDNIVRKAIKLSIERAQIISSIYKNKYVISNFPLDYGSYLSSTEEEKTENQEEAKRLLMNNGWVYKEEVWQKEQNGVMQYLELDIIANKNDEEKKVGIEEIKNQLENIGIKINLLFVSQKEYENYLENKNYDLIYCQEILSISPELSKFIGNNNPSNYNSNEMSILLNELKNIKDEKQLKEKYQECRYILEEEAINIPLFRNKEVCLYHSNLMGDITPNFYSIFYNIEGWYKQEE